LRAELTAALGDVSLTPVIVASIQRAAELGVIAADLRAARLRGEQIDIAPLVKAENAFRRAVSELGIKPTVQRDQRHLSLDTYLAQKPTS
jgi:hypothetical protein